MTALLVIIVFYLSLLLLAFGYLPSKFCIQKFTGCSHPVYPTQFLFRKSEEVILNKLFFIPNVAKVQNNFCCGACEKAQLLA